jgi:hypothetical protein
MTPMRFVAAAVVAAAITAGCGSDERRIDLDDGRRS